MKILLAEDEKTLSHVIAKGLRKLGYAVDTAYDGEEAFFCYEVNDYDLLILDLNLPKLDGIGVLRRIRETDEETKVLVLTARSAVEERVLGLDAGANDYLVKPFDFSELSARIRALLRRSFVQNDAVYVCGRVALDSLKKKVCVDGQELNLTKKEYAILEYLMIEKERVLSAEEIIEHVWESDTDIFSNAFKFHLHFLKKKLAEASQGVVRIQNKRGQGYWLRGAEEDV